MIISFQSGGMSSTYLNLARAVCRRAERCVYPLVFAEQVDAEVGRYLNRLSDFLFAAGRAAALIEGREELLWIKAVLPSTITKEANAAASSALDSFNIASGSCAAMTGKSSKRKTLQSEAQSQSKNSASVADLDLSQHSTQTPANSDTTFEGFGDEFFDPSAASNSSLGSGSGSGSILGKGSDKNSHKSDDDGSISSKSAASSSSKARYVRTSRIIPRVAVLGSSRVSVTSPTSPSTSSLNTRKPFSTRMDVLHTSTPKPLY